jgi:hypothetical protein
VDVDELIEPRFGTCPCGRRGEWLVWNKAVRIGTFSCDGHLKFVKKRYGGGPVEKV